MKLDDRGADTLPMALVTAVIVTALIVGIAAAGIKNASPEIESSSVDSQAGNLVADCQALLTCSPRYLDDPWSPAGATRVVEIVLPASTEYFGFGPDGIVYYSVAGRNKALVVDPGVSFRARGDGTLKSALEGGPVKLQSGRYWLQIEYASDAMGNRYLLINSSA